MSFGAELKDFVQSFQAGYNLVKSREEKQWEREKREMDRADHQRIRERDAIGDEQWERSDEFRRRQQEQLERERGLSHGRWETEEARRQRMLDWERSGGAGYRDDDAAAEDLGESYRRYNGGVIPDGADDEGVSASPIAYRQSQAFVDDIVGARHPSLVQNESGGRWNAQNNAVGSGGARGHYGRIQFGVARLNDAKRAGVIPRTMTPQQFMASPKAQMAAERWHFADIDREARRRGLTKFIGATVGGVRVTPDAIRAMAHLGGIGGAERFLKTGGRYNPKDANGTSLRDYGIRHGGTRRKPVYAAVGGLIEEPEEETFSVFDMPAGSLAEDAGGDIQVAQAEGAIPLPDDGPIPPPKYEGVMEGEAEEPTDDPWEQGRRAVRDGMKRALEESGAGVNAPIDDPDLERRRQNYIRGYGAAHPQVMKQAMDLIDPERKMPAGERNIKAIGFVYNYYIEKGDYEKATAAAGEMVQSMRVMAQQQWALAQAAASKGDIDNAARAAVAAYANIPNGRDLKVTKTESGQYEVSVTDEKTGKQITKQVLSPNELAAAAMRFNPATFDEEIFAAAGKAPDAIEAAKFEDRETASENAAMELEELVPPGQDEFYDEYRGDMGNLAGAIAGTDGNNMSTSSAARLIHGFIDGVQVTIEGEGEDAKPVAKRPFTAKKKPNSDIWEVTYSEGGSSSKVLMSTNQYNTLNRIMSARADKLEAEVKREKKDAASSDNVSSNFNKAMNATMEALKKKPPSPMETLGGIIPDGMIPKAAPPAQEGPNEARIAELLNARQNLMYSGVNDPADERLRKIDEELKSLGYE